MKPSDNQKQIKVQKGKKKSYKNFGKTTLIIQFKYQNTKNNEKTKNNIN